MLVLFIFLSFHTKLIFLSFRFAAGCAETSTSFPKIFPNQIWVDFSSVSLLLFLWLSYVYKAVSSVAVKIYIYLKHFLQLLWRCVRLFLKPPIARSTVINSIEAWFRFLGQLQSCKFSFLFTNMNRETLLMRSLDHELHSLLLCSTLPIPFGEDFIIGFWEFCFNKMGFL